MCTVVNLATREKLIYTCDPKIAVICAYAQSKGDFNTWDYDKNYLHLVLDRNSIWSCGDFSTFKDGRDF
jgi:hypothetical protein